MAVLCLSIYKLHINIKIVLLQVVLKPWINEFNSVLSYLKYVFINSDVLSKGTEHYLNLYLGSQLCLISSLFEM